MKANNTTMNEQTKQYFRNVYGSYQNLCEQADERLATLRAELQEYNDNHSKGGSQRKRNMQWLQEDIKKLEQMKEECKQAFEDDTTTPATMNEARNKENTVIFNDLWNKYNPSKAVDADTLNYYKKYYDAHKKDFKHWKKTKASIKVYDDATEAGLKTPLKVGDVVCFTNDYGVKFAPLEVMGFCDKDYLNGRVVFLNTESYWFPVRPESLEILMSF